MEYVRNTCTTVLVTGGRDYANPSRVFAALDTMAFLYGDLLVIHGSATGADTYAEEWAKKRQHLYLGVPAQWDKYGKTAGMKRNAELAAIGFSEDAQNHVLAFSGGRGTRNMVSIANSFKADGYPISIWLVDGEFWK